MSRRSARKTEAADADSGYITSRLRLFGIALICAKIALVPLVFDPSLDMPFTVSKAVLSHGLAYVLAGVLAGLFVQFGPGVFRRSWLHLPVIAFLAVNAVAALLAADPVLALFGTHARMLGLVSIADGVLLYFAIALLVRTRADAIALAISGFGAAFVVLGYEVVQILGRDPFSWSIDGAVRPFSTLGESTALAQYLTSLAICALSCGLLVNRLRPAVRATLVACAGLLLVGSVATGTRSAIVGVAVGSALLLLFYWLLHPDRQARTVALVCTAAAIAVLGGVLLLTPLGARLAATIEAPQGGDDQDLLDRLEPSTAGRVTLYAIGLQMVRERPILGYGPDNFTVGVPRYRPEVAPEQIRQSLATSAHSWAIQVAATSGVVGLTCFLAIAASAVAHALRNGLRPTALAGAATLAAFLGTGLTTVNEFGTEWIFWASAGIIAAATASQASAGESPQRRPRDKKQRSPGGSSNVRVFAPIASVVAAALVALSGWTAFDASRAARASQDARQQGQSLQAIDLGLRATRSDPQRANYWDTLGLAYIGASRWQEASAAFDRARRLAPYDVRYTNDLVQAQLLLASAGDAGAGARAIQFADEAVKIDPNNPRPHVTRAVAMLASGNLAEALRSVERALALDPGSTNGTLYVIAVQAMSGSARTADAIQVARRGLAVLGRSRSSVPLRIELARVLVLDSKPADALAELDVALSIQPNEPTAARLRAEIQASIPR
jgi:cytochrome c-type biogenesis protein CcmH/NrfG